jgi:peptidase C13-like protein
MISGTHLPLAPAVDTDTPHFPFAIEVNTTEVERITAIGAAGRRLTAEARRRGSLPRALLLWAAIGFVLAYLFEVEEASFIASGPVLPGIGATLVILGLFLAWSERRRLTRRVAQAQADAYRLSLDAEGLRLDGESRGTHLQWRDLEAVERLPDSLILHLKGYTSLLIPHRCLPEGMTPEALIATLQAATGRPLPHSTRAFAEPGGAGAGLLGDLGRNLLAGTLFLLLRPSAVTKLAVSVPQLIVLLALPMLLSAGLQLWRVGLNSDFNPAGLGPLFFGLPWVLLAAWASARTGMKEGRTLSAAVALAALWLVVNLIQTGLFLLPQETWRRMDEAATLVWWGPIAYGYLASVPTLVRTIGMLPEERLGAVLAVVGLLIVPVLLRPGEEALWVERHDPAAAAASRARWERTTREAVLYEQTRLLDTALDGVQPGRPGVPELFLLAVGGYGGQDVFLREVGAVEAMFRTRFDTAGHSIVLVNNPATVDDRPIASVTALARSLKRIGQRMNPEDILFLFMTSHGSRDHRFDLSLWPYRFDELTPERLRALLDEAGIRYRVIVVSACYSGGFIKPLTGNDTLVMSAAAQDRNSHGCSHEADWTFFGRAFFPEALANTYSFETAFDQASAAVASREKTEGFEPSLPQIAVGNGIRVALKGLEQRLTAASSPSDRRQPPSQ